jgi:hypothetical protein
MGHMRSHGSFSFHSVVYYNLLIFLIVCVVILIIYFYSYLINSIQAQCRPYLLEVHPPLLSQAKLQCGGIPHNTGSKYCLPHSSTLQMDTMCRNIDSFTTD